MKRLFKPAPPSAITILQRRYPVDSRVIVTGWGSGPKLARVLKVDYSGRIVVQFYSPTLGRFTYGFETFRDSSLSKVDG